MHIGIALWFTNLAVLCSVLVWSSVYLGDNVKSLNIDPKIEIVSVALTLSKIESLLIRLYARYKIFSEIL